MFSKHKTESSEPVLNFQQAFYWRNNFIMTPGITTCYITQEIRLGFHNKSKHVECKFTIYTSHRAHCLADSVLFPLDRRIHMNKKNAHTKLHHGTFVFKIHCKQNSCFKNPSFSSTGDPDFQRSMFFFSLSCVILITSNYSNSTNNSYRLEIERRLTFVKFI